MGREKVKQARRIVVKVGTNSLFNGQGDVNFQRIDRLAYTLSTLVREDKEMVLVSSGAMGVGAVKLGLEKRPEDIPSQQAVSAVGQVELMSTYSRFFSYYDCNVAQILITRDVIDYHDSLENIENAFQTLLKNHIIPVVNENDAVAVDELDHKSRFGDNDTLSAIVANIVDADLLIMLSDVDGFYNANPNTDPDAQKFDVITEISPEMYEMAGEHGSAFSTGGMKTKLQAAEKILANDRTMVIMSSEDPSDIMALLQGEKIGTVFGKSDKEE